MDLLGRLWRIARAQVGKTRPAGRAEMPYDREDSGWGHAGPQAPPAQDPRLAQYYANLEIPYGSDLGTARQAWKNLLKKYHPDLHAADPEKRRLANELSARLTQAFQELERTLKTKEKT